MSKIIDISLQIKEGMIIYPGNTRPSIKPLKRVPKDSSSLTEILLGSHTGTHVDTGLHVDEKSSGLERVSLDGFVGICQVLDLACCAKDITAKDLEKKVFSRHIVLFKTRNSLDGYDDFNPAFIHLSEDGARYIAGLCLVKTIGIDYLSVQKFRKGDQKTHKLLLGNNINVIEGLNLSEAMEKEYFFAFLPLKINNLNGVPDRAILIDNY
ncbi:cyclase family protein [Candidatus Woesearchaeota archaeon]|nr:cyclase family protein [Candidatus Woesearchaeota archaeon]